MIWPMQTLSRIKREARLVEFVRQRWPCSSALFLLGYSCPAPRTAENRIAKSVNQVNDLYGMIE